MTSHLFQNQNQNQNNFYKPDLQFYSNPQSASSLDGVSGTMGAGGAGFTSLSPNSAGFMSSTYAGPWYHAFGSGGLDGEEPLLNELGINFSHILTKSLAVLNPFSNKVDDRLMDDADLAGPLVFWGAFGLALLLVRVVYFEYPAHTLYSQAKLSSDIYTASLSSAASASTRS